MKQQTGRKLLGFILMLVLAIGLLPGTGSTAYADGFEVTRFKPPEAWIYDTTFLTVDDLPSGFAAFDASTASSWNAPTNGHVCLICGFVKPDKVTIVHFYNGHWRNSVTSPFSRGYIFSDYGANLYYTSTSSYSVTLSGGANAVASGGSLTQNVPAGSDMTAVSYTAVGGYNFPESSEYYKTENGITVARTSDTVVTVSGKPKAAAKMTITIPDAVSAYSVSVAPSASQRVLVGKSVKLTASVLPENAQNKKVKWSIGGNKADAVKLFSDQACAKEIETNAATNVLTVYAKGMGQGRAIVTATSDEDSTKTASVNVNVFPVATVSPANAGTVSTAPSSYDETIEYTAKPNNGYAFDKWEYVYNNQTQYINKNPVGFDPDTASVKALFVKVTNYPLWIGGVQATSLNQDNVLKDDSANDGKVSFTPATEGKPAVLRMSGVNITKEYSRGNYTYGIRYDGKDPLNIVLSPGSNNTIKKAEGDFSTGIYIYNNVNLSVSGGGTLTVAGSSGGIVSYGDLSIEAGTVSASGSGEESNGIRTSKNIAINGGTVNASASGENAAGIEATKDIVIKNGKVTATGTGKCSNGIYSGNNITISGGTVNASSTGYRGNGLSGTHITINNGEVTASATDYGFGIYALTAYIGNGKITAVGGDTAIGNLMSRYVLTTDLDGRGWKETDGSGDGEPIRASGSALDLFYYRKVLFPAAHEHDFKYTASGATITATCTAEFCPDKEGNVPYTETMTLTVPEHTEYGDGKETQASVTGQITGTETPAVVYRKGATALSEAPVDAGTYTAKITVQNVTASIEYTIAKKQVTVTGITANSKTYDETTNATLDCSKVSISGKLAEDELGVTAEGAFEDADAGESKRVNVQILALTGAAKDNYVLAATGHQTATIARIAPAELTTVTITPFVQIYDDKEKSVTVTKVLAGKLTVPSDAYTVSGASATNAGNYTVTVTANTGSNYSGTATASYHIVSPGAKYFNSEITIPEGGYTYTGKEILPEVAVTDAETGEKLSSDSYSVEYWDNTDAGYGKAKVTGKDNYATQSGPQIHVFPINKADSAVTAPTGKTLTYNDALQELVQAGSTDDGTLKYALTTEEKAGPADTAYSTAIPAGENAGTYYIWYKVVGDENHNNTAPAVIASTINPAALTEVTLSATELRYNGEAQTADIAEIRAGNLDVPADACEVNGNTQTEVGDYTVTVTAKSGGNYTGKCETTFSILPQTANVFETKLSGTEFTYTGAAIEPEVTVTDGETILVKNTDYEIEYIDNVDAGTGKVKVSGRNRYTGTRVHVFRINPAECSVTPPTARNLTGTSLPQALVEAGAVKGGEMQYVIGTDAEDAPTDGWSTEIPEGTDPGTYYVWYKAVGDANHSDSEAICVTSRIRGETSVLVTFKVVNGFWDDGTAEDKPVMLEGAEGGGLKLADGDIPAVGNRPAEGYRAGSWDVMPDTMTVFTKDMTYTYTYAAASGPEPDPILVNKLEEFVRRCYRMLLGREADAAGLKTWTDQMASGNLSAAEVLQGFVFSDEFRAKNLDQATTLDIVGRMMAALTEDVKRFTEEVQKGTSVSAAINGLSASNEFDRIRNEYDIRSDFGNENGARTDILRVRAFVTRCYQGLLGREPDANGMNYWAEALASGKLTAAQVVMGFLNSEEFAARKPGNEAIVSALYRTMLDRTTDETGQAKWTGVLEGGQPVSVVVNGISASDEFRKICEECGVNPGSAPSGSEPSQPEPQPTVQWNAEKVQEFIALLYRKGLNREADAEGMAYWTDTIMSGKSTPAKAARAILNSNEMKARNLGNGDFIRTVYAAMLGRDAGAEEVDYWLAKLEGEHPASRSRILNDIAKSEEFIQIQDGMKTPGSV